MNPNNLSEKLPQPTGSEQSSDIASSAETLPTPAEAVPPAAIPAEKVVELAQSQTPPAAPPTQPPVIKDDSQLTASDSDVIEKTWIDKAEQIIDQNQDDPYNEGNQKDKLSQDYQKKRFNIDVNDG